MFGSGFSLGPRPDRDGWFRIGQVEVTTTALLVGLGVLSMFVYAASPAALEQLYFLPTSVRAGEVWRVFTWPLANPPTEIWVVLTLAFFWFMGHRIEDQLGRVRYSIMLAVAAIVPAVLVSLIPITAVTGGAAGLGVLAIGLLVVVAVDNPSLPFLFGIPAWVLALVFVGIDILRYLGPRLWGLLLLELGVIAVACLMAASFGMLDRLSFVPRVGAPSPAGPTSGRRTRRGARRGRRGAEGNVTVGPWRGGPPAGPTAAESAELDGLLDKISISGIKSLTKGEQRRLDELSRRMRGT